MKEKNGLSAAQVQDIKSELAANDAKDESSRISSDQLYQTIRQRQERYNEGLSAQAAGSSASDLNLSDEFKFPLSLQPAQQAKRENVTIEELVARRQQLWRDLTSSFELDVKRKQRENASCKKLTGYDFDKLLGDLKSFKDTATVQHEEQEDISVDLTEKMSTTDAPGSSLELTLEDEEEEEESRAEESLLDHLEELDSMEEDEFEEDAESISENVAPVVPFFPPLPTSLDALDSWVELNKVRVSKLFLPVLENLK